MYAERERREKIHTSDNCSEGMMKRERWRAVLRDLDGSGFRAIATRACNACQVFQSGFHEWKLEQLMMRHCSYGGKPCTYKCPTQICLLQLHAPPPFLYIYIYLDQI